MSGCSFPRYAAKAWKSCRPTNNARASSNTVTSSKRGRCHARPGLQRRQHRVRTDIIMIDLPGRRKAAVEIRRHLLAGHDADRRGQFRVERGHPVERIHRDLRRRIEMRDLPERMHAGIRAAGSLQPDRLFRHLFKRAHDEILHRVSAGLRLPAIVMAGRRRRW